MANIFSKNTEVIIYEYHETIETLLKLFFMSDTAIIWTHQSYGYELHHVVCDLRLGGFLEKS
jgi:hypothetical protein